MRLRYRMVSDRDAAPLTRRFSEGAGQVGANPPPGLGAAPGRLGRDVREMSGGELLSTAATSS